MTVKITDDQETMLRALLNGRPPTPENVADLLNELQGRRLAEELKAASAEPTAAEKENEILRASLKQMMDKIDDLGKARAAEDTDQAIVGGQLPPPNISAPPLGYGDLPRGTWFMSPFSVNRMRFRVKLCDCGRCSSTRELHYYCTICGGGPHDIQSMRAGFTKHSMAPANLWGLAHYSCPGPCTTQFMGQLGQAPAMVTPGPAASAPNLPISTPEPAMPLVMAGSD